MKAVDFEDFEDDEMDMPTPCVVCGCVFDLMDGRGSIDQPNIIICKDCHEDEEMKSELEDELEALESELKEAEYSVKTIPAQIQELKKKLSRL